MFCTNCGTEFESRFCPKCGTPAAVASDDVHLSIDQSPQPPTVLAGNSFFKVTVRPGKATTARQQKMADTYAQREASKEVAKQRFAENKLNKIPMCPKCGSTSIQPDNGKFHLGRAIVGDTLLGSGGSVMGLTHGKKVPMICLNCGHRWKLK